MSHDAIAFAGPRQYQPRRWLPVLLGLICWISVTGVGARLAYNFQLRRPPYARNADLFPWPWLWRHPHYFWLGVPFSTALLGILLAHEWGHVWACRRHGLAASYPHFLPAPSLLGTLGAFIRIHSPFGNRRALLDVGMAGPLAGFMIAVPVFVYGLRTSALRAYPAAATALHFGWPMMAAILKPLAGAGRHAALMLSPVARAAWFGFLATALNLLPIGQLDGGHIIYAFFPRAHRWISWGVTAVLLAAGGWLWTGWLLWAGVGIVMRGRHPYVPATGERLGAGRIAWAAACGLMLILTLCPRPVWTG
jgi:membrane-associated protease RseP (regulator of RpoE activity)